MYVTTRSSADARAGIQTSCRNDTPIPGAEMTTAPSRAHRPEAEPEGLTRRPLGPVLSFMRSLWGVNHALESTSLRMKARIGVTGPERMVLRLVGRYPGIAAGELARILRVHPGTGAGYRPHGNGCRIPSARVSRSWTDGAMGSWRDLRGRGAPRSRLTLLTKRTGQQTASVRDSVLRSLVNPDQDRREPQRSPRARCPQFR